MRLILTTLLFLIFPFTYQQESKYKDFIHYVSGKYFIPKSVISNCNWHYAIVKVTVIDKRIVNYEILNEASDDLKKSFKYLIGYKFTSQAIIKKQTLVFCLTIENLKTVCDIPKTISYTPTEVLNLVMPILAHQKEVEPNTVFLLNPIISIADDTRY